MTPGIAALLLGIFVVPPLLLWSGHRLRRRPPRWRSSFWGAAVGHALAIIAGSIAGMIPPEEWAATDYVRGLFALWSFLLFPAIGALIGWMRGAR